MFSNSKIADDSVQLKCPIELYRGTIARARSSRLSLLRTHGTVRSVWFLRQDRLFKEVRYGNGLDPESSNRLWVSSLNASVAFLLAAVPLSRA
jgi:hypothetical protein